MPESERFNFAQQGSTANYAESARGAYMAFFDSNIQPDWVHIDHVEEYAVAYLPYPVMLSRKSADKLRAYVEKGGFLISEGLPAYFGDLAHAGQTQPNYNLDTLFGAREADVEFTPDLLENLTWTMGGRTLGGRFFRQVYRTAGGKEAGRYGDGGVAAVEHSAGKGRTMLMGTFPAASYFRKQQAGTREAFRALLPNRQRVTVSDPAVIARLHEGTGGTVLWVMNPARQAKTVTAEVAGGPWRSARDLWGQTRPEVKGSAITVTVPERDGAVLKLE